MNEEVKPASVWGRLNGSLEKFSIALGWLAGLMAVTLAFIIGYQILTRELNVPSDWTFDISIYLFMWLAFLGGAYTMRQRTHITMELLTANLPKKVQRALWFIASAIAIAYLASLLYESWGQMATSLVTGRTTIGTIHIPMWVNHAALMVGVFVTLLEFVRQYACEARGLVFTRHKGRGSGASGEPEAEVGE